jgi:hypothetical protein
LGSSCPPAQEGPQRLSFQLRVGADPAPVAFHPSAEVQAAATAVQDLAAAVVGVHAQRMARLAIAGTLALLFVASFFSLKQYHADHHYRHDCQDYEEVFHRGVIILPVPLGVNVKAFADQLPITNMSPLFSA